MIDQLPTTLGWRSDPDTVLPLMRPSGRAEVDRQAAADPILLAVDEAPLADAALERVATLARSRAVEVVVLRVVESPTPRAVIMGTAPRRATAYLLPGDPYALADAQRQVDWLAMRLEIRGVAAQGRAILGRLPDTILETADRIGAGLIALGGDPRRAPDRAADDGGATVLARQVCQPTLLVRPGEPAARTDYQPRAESW